jgi:hypothetical protein
MERGRLDRVLVKVIARKYRTTPSASKQDRTVEHFESVSESLQDRVWMEFRHSVSRQDRLIAKTLFSR